MRPSLVLIRPVSAPLRQFGGGGGHLWASKPRLQTLQTDKLARNRAKKLTYPSVGAAKVGGVVAGRTQVSVQGRRRFEKADPPPKTADPAALPPPPFYFIYELQAKMLLYIINSPPLLWLRLRRRRAADVGGGVITFWPGSHPFPFKNLQDS